jgi:hypothetical protein
MDDAEHTLEFPVPAFPELDHNPDAVSTQEIPVVPAVPALPPHLVHDPILEMPAPHLHQESLFEYYYGDGPRMVPPRPHKSPRRPIRMRDHALAAMAASVVVLGTASYVMVESGWNSGIPQAQQAPVTREFTPTRAPVVPEDSAPSQVPAAQEPKASPAYIPQELPTPTRSPLAPSMSPSASPGPIAPSQAPTKPPVPSVPSHSPSAPSASPTPSASPSPTASGTGLPTVGISVGVTLAPLSGLSSFVPRLLQGYLE